MRKLFFVFVTVLWIAAGFQLILNLNEKEDEQIVEAFNGTNCMEAMSRISVNGKLQTEYLTKEDQKKMLEETALLLGLKGNYTVEEEVQDGRSVLFLTKEAASASVALRIVSVEEEVYENMISTTQYFIGEIELYDNLDCAVIYRENMEKALEQLQAEGQVNLEFSGRLPGELETEEKDALVEKLLKSISANTVRQQKGDGLYTVYAYTKIEEESQKVNGEKVNVNVAVTYDEEADCTRLYLAVPYLTQDY